MSSIKKIYSCDLATIKILDIVDHRQAFPVQYSDHYLNIGQFDNRTQIYLLNNEIVTEYGTYVCFSIMTCKFIFSSTIA